MFEHPKENEILIGKSEKYLNWVFIGSIAFFSALQISNALLHLFSSLKSISCIFEPPRFENDKKELLTLDKLEFFDSYHSYICGAHNIMFFNFFICIILFLFMSLLSNYRPKIIVKPLLISIICIAIYYHAVFFGGFGFTSSPGRELTLHPASQSVYVAYILVAPWGCAFVSSFCLIVSRMVQAAFLRLNIMR